MTKVTRLTLEQGGVLERRRLHLREISDDADAPLDTVGQDLRAARQRKGEDLAAVSQALKIRKEHLAALEEGDIQALPGRAYAIGFVRSYAEHLGLDPAACVERFKAEIAGRGEAEDPTPVFQVEEEERKLPQGWIVFVALLLVAVIWGGYYLSVSANRMLAQSVTPVPQTLARQAGIDQRAPAPKPAPAPPTTVAVPPTVAALQPQAAPSTETEPAVLPPGNAYGTGNDNSRVTLRVHRLTRVLVQGPGGTVYINRTLRPGDTYQAPNLVGLVVTAGDAEGVEVILDGEPVGRLGRGAINGVSLNPQDIMDRASSAQSG
jgi:cytoskeleton protein RodZ